MTDRQPAKDDEKSVINASLYPSAREKFLEESLLQAQTRLNEVRLRLEASEERFRNIIDKSADGIIVVDKDGVVRFMNQAVESLFGDKSKKLLGSYFGFPLTAGESSDLTIVRGTGDMSEVEMRVTETQWEGEMVYLASLRDITRRKRAEERILHDAFHNPLSGLPNRALFMDRLGMALERLRRNEDYSFAVLYMDLDRFKLINNSMGQTAGDKVLVSVSKKLESCLRKVDTIAHLGGDEFAVLIDGVNDLGEAMQVVSRINSELKSPIEVNGEQVFITMSIGIRFGIRDCDDPETPLRDAETAMHRAKENGGESCQIFDREMHVKAMKNLHLEAEIRRAVEKHEFRIHYQPIVSTLSGKITGFEPLLRWEHPERGLLAAGEFIHVINETGLIVPICEISLHTACEQSMEWISRGFHPVYASVNISPVQLRQYNFVDSIARVLKDTGLDPSLLVLEFTEDSVIQDMEVNLKILHQLRAMGMGISIDDFGTGYSSLSYLKRFPVTSIKIDRSFVKGLPQDSDDSAIVRAIITMAHSLGLKVTAEGVETEEQLEVLRRLDCDELQGYLFSRPIPANEFEELLKFYSLIKKEA